MSLVGSISPSFCLPNQARRYQRESTWKRDHFLLPYLDCLFGQWTCLALHLSEKRKGNWKWKDREWVSGGIACILSVWLSKDIRVSCGHRDTEEDSWAWAILLVAYARGCLLELGGLKEMTWSKIVYIKSQISWEDPWDFLQNTHKCPIRDPAFSHLPNIHSQQWFVITTTLF